MRILKKIGTSAAFVVSLFVFLSGVLNIYSAFYTHHPLRSAILQELLPVTVTHTTRTLTALTGFFLIFLSGGIRKRKYRAWWISITLLAVSIILHLAKGLDAEEVAILLIPLILLLVFRADFTVRSARQKLIQRIKISAVALLLLILYSTGGFFLLQGQFNRPATWTNIYKDYEFTITGGGQNTLIPATRRAIWFEDSIAIMGLAMLFWVLAVLFGPEIFSPQITEGDLAQAKKLVQAYGFRPVSYLSLMEDKQYYFSKNNQCLISYKISSNTAITLGDPIGPAQQLKDFVVGFYNQLKQQGLSVAFYLVAGETASFYRELGLKLLKVGDDAVIKIADFNLAGPRMKNVRNAVTHINRQGITFAWYSMDQLPWFALRQIQRLYETWLDKRSPMAFSMDFFPFPPEEKGQVLAVFDASKNLCGAFSFFPYKQNLGQMLDMMIRSKDSHNGLVEASFAEAIKHFKEQGVTEISLGLATRTSSEQKGAQSGTAQKAVDFFYKNFDQFYPYQSLAKFKEKFNPQWQARYLAYESDAELPKIALALTQIHIKGGLLKI